MKIVVCVKQTPDTAATLSVTDGKADWGDSPLVLNPWDEYAVEAALQTKESSGGSVTAVCLGPPAAEEALKQALAMGCDEAILLTDPALLETDSLGVASALAAAVRTIGDVDLVFFGKASVDTATGVVFAQTARKLDWPLLSLVAAISNLEADGGSITAERLLGGGRQVVSADLPVVISVVKEINEPRYPSFMGIRKASKAEIPHWGPGEVGLKDEVAPRLHWPSVTVPAGADTTVEMIEGETAADKGRSLAARLIEEKII